jgi:large subunit ribosomal protein L9
MKVILKKDVKELGKKGATVEVSDGYARNYLIPRGIAVEASVGALRSVEAEKATAKKNEERLIAELKALRDKLAEKPVTVPAKTGEGGRLFGSITNKDIAEAISKMLGKEFDRKRIELENPIKNVGTYTVTLKFGHDIQGKITVNVVEA